MPTNTYTALATVTLASTATTITFSSIPGTYRDLVLVINGSISSTGSFELQLNGDTASNYSDSYFLGYLTTTGSAQRTANNIQLGYESANGIRSNEIQVMDYSATDKHKSVLARSSTPGHVMGITGRWANTSAITSMKIYASAGNIAVGSTFSLYGVIL